MSIHQWSRVIIKAKWGAVQVGFAELPPTTQSALRLRLLVFVCSPARGERSCSLRLIPSKGERSCSLRLIPSKGERFCTLCLVIEFVNWLAGFFMLSQYALTLP